MNIVNLTPHDVTVLNTDGSIKCIYKSAVRNNTMELPRVVVTKRNIGYINDIPLSEVHISGVEHIPEYTQDTIYIVSKLVSSAIPYRGDLVSPDGLVKDSAGNICGCTGFCRG
jgi:hypothetical protein